MRGVRRPPGADARELPALRASCAGKGDHRQPPARAVSEPRSPGLRSFDLRARRLVSCVRSHFTADHRAAVGLKLMRAIRRCKEALDTGH